MAISGNQLTLHTARVGACRVGAVRLGFVATDVQDHKVGDAAPNPNGGNFYVWKEVEGPTTSWTVVREP